MPTYCFRTSSRPWFGTRGPSTAGTARRIPSWFTEVKAYLSSFIEQYVAELRDTRGVGDLGTPEDARDPGCAGDELGALRRGQEAAGERCDDRRVAPQRRARRGRVTGDE